ncbi:GNAT family N-acetyltransferase [Bacillus sp. FJAT-52991]|uniref:GNAT family N-acetyltransferase n=1 Tax=Bacillus kandeliae TaxID=3129297 RepID=A0ABZ2NAH0_9BACI
MIKELDITNRKVAEEVLNVQLLSYQIEADIIGFSDLPPLKDTVETLQPCGETFFGYFINEELCGAISIKIEKDMVDIHRLIVHPKHFRKGIAEKLLNIIEKKQEVEKVIVSTGSKNTPAVQFYLKHGFQVVEEIKVNEHLSLTRFEKKRSF